MKIGILGSGDVGRRLGDGCIELGHMVKIGTRDPSKGKVVQWVSNHGGEEGKASAGTFTEAASFGEMIVIATSWDGTSNVIKMADPTNFAGKIVIDVTNKSSSKFLKELSQQYYISCSQKLILHSPNSLFGMTYIYIYIFSSS